MRRAKGQIVPEFLNDDEYQLDSFSIREQNLKSNLVSEHYQSKNAKEPHFISIYLKHKNVEDFQPSDFRYFKIENSKSTEIDNISLIHSNKYVYFLNKKKMNLNRLALDTLVSLNLQPILEKLGSTMDYTLHIEPKKHQIYLVLFEKKKENQKEENYFTIYEIIDKMLQLQLQTIISGVKLNITEEIYELKKLTISENNINLYCTLKKNKGFIFATI